MPKTILIVEDDNSLRQVLKDKITHAGYSVIESANGENGLEVALTQHPDLILLDILMPGMDGETMLGFVRDDAWGKDVPVIILTNLSYLHKEKSKGHANEYLIKANTKLETIVETINKYLNKHV